MNKADLIAGLASINDAELVLFQLADGTVCTPASIGIQQEEPPIHALVVTETVTKAALQSIADERQAVRDEAARIEAEQVELARQREELAETQRAEREAALQQQADEEAAARQAALDQAVVALEAEMDTRIDAAVKAALARADQARAELTTDTPTRGT